MQMDFSMGTTFYLRSFLLLTPLLTSPCNAFDPLIITTKKGQVQGKFVPVQHNQVGAFLGIPYGKPPVGKLRFRPPVPADRWEGVKDATEYPNSCFQPNLTRTWKQEAANTFLSEDCLYLNVWTPLVRNAQSSPLNVMIWIYGGGFVIGTSSLPDYDGRYLAYYEDVVVVSMNYRLGALGFLSLPDNDNVRGNAGLLDQRLAIQWVLDNIAAFGGDPSKVTLFGESAGSMSAGLHVLSPGSRDLFQRAALESGAPVAVWTLCSQTEAWKKLINSLHYFFQATKLGTLLGCPTLNSTELETCLQNTSASLLVHTQFALDAAGFIKSPFIPVIDGVFLPDTVQALINDDRVPKKDLMTGFNRDEGIIFIELSEVPGFDQGPSLITREQFLFGLGISFPHTHSLVKNAVTHEYTDWTDEKNHTKNRDALSEFATDYLFICPAFDFARRYAQAGGNIYTYEFTHRSSLNPWPKWMGATHLSEIVYVFGIPQNPSHGFTEEEVNLSRRMMKHWANFARTGNPSTDKFKWPPLTPENKEYITLNTSPPEIKTHFKAEKCHFWNNIFPQIMNVTAALQTCAP
ncbi:acetylcholinesterase-like isoform X1 [Nelusetta ayraudi]|uniref:acetylcholinesterase-like isoform X1 n=1 Tax=Nelusetta ayraudi TaxID=303726 RepID=UPI003F6FE146